MLAPGSPVAPRAPADDCLWVRQAAPRSLQAKEAKSHSETMLLQEQQRAEQWARGLVLGWACTPGRPHLEGLLAVAVPTGSLVTGSENICEQGGSFPFFFLQL